jgi:diguanylate cyclase (GGDEF)-like protein
MPKSMNAPSTKAVRDFGVVRFQTFRSFAIRLGVFIACFPILTILADGVQRPDLLVHFLISRGVWTALLLAYPVALVRRVPRPLLPWILYGCTTLLMLLSVREQIRLGLRIPEILLTFSLVFVVVPMLGLAFSWKENAVGVGALLVALNAQLWRTPELLPFLPRLELVTFYLVASMAFAHHQFHRLIASQFDYQCRIEELAHKDPLTGICNRRSFMELGERLLKRGARSKRPASLLMVDLDHFKKVNDRFGHAAGDAVIRASASLMVREVRPTDLLARIGGEEFVILLPHADRATGLQVAERIRQGIAALAIPFEGLAQPLTITASLGLAVEDSGVDSLDSLMAKADQALYQAKGGGRNRVVAHEPITLPSQDTCQPVS